MNYRTQGAAEVPYIMRVNKLVSDGVKERAMVWGFKLTNSDKKIDAFCP